jgi:hypothetical protein
MGMLVYRTIYVKTPHNSQKNAFFDIFFKLFLYIPCLFSDGFDVLMKTLFFRYDAETKGSLLLILITIVLFLLYWYFPSIQGLVSTQGGKLLVDNPVGIDEENTLANYEQLNGTNTNGSFEPNYQFALSFWVFIESAQPSTNSHDSQFTSLLNFGEKPNVQYNATTNTLRIIMNQKELGEKGSTTMLEFDEQGNRILYENKNVLLQKWNNIIINCNGGTLDVFLNGELVKSAIEVVPFYTMDLLTIGAKNGVKGGICNVVYYKKPLTTTNIYYIYHSMKNTSPPAPQKTNQTIDFIYKS